MQNFACGGSLCLRAFPANTFTFLYLWFRRGLDVAGYTCPRWHSWRTNRLLPTVTGQRWGGWATSFRAGHFARFFPLTHTHTHCTTFAVPSRGRDNLSGADITYPQPFPPRHPPQALRADGGSSRLSPARERYYSPWPVVGSI